MSDGNDSGNPMAGFMEKLQQAQGQIKQMESRMGEASATGESGGGMVKVTANGRMEITAIKIDADAIDPTDPEMLEDLVLSATNQALANVRQSMAQQMAGLAGGMGFPFPGS